MRKIPHDETKIPAKTQHSQINKNLKPNEKLLQKVYHLVGFSILTRLCNHQHWLQSLFITPQKKFCPHQRSLLFFFSPEPGNQDSPVSLWVCVLRTFHINKITQDIALPSHFFRFSECFQGSSIWWHISVEPDLCVQGFCVCRFNQLWIKTIWKIIS